MQIDHIFMFVEPDGIELAYLLSLGLIETYRRTHHGQGTQNICFCFDNMFIECLWVTDIAALQSDAMARTGLYERSQWRTTGTNPFGIAWRTTADAAPFTPATWAFRPPYLPAGTSIDVGVDGDDPRQPMMFRSPGATAPLHWPAEKRHDLQRPAGLGRILALRLELPQAIAPSPTLTAMARATCLDVQSASTAMSRLTVDVERIDDHSPLIIRLPVDT